MMIAVGVTSLALAIGAIAIPLLSHFGVLFPFHFGMIPACEAVGGGLALFALGCVALAHRKVHLSDEMIKDLKLGQIDAYCHDADFFRAKDAQGRTVWKIAIQENCPAAVAALIESGKISKAQIEHAICHDLTVELMDHLISKEERQGWFRRAMEENKIDIIHIYLNFDPQYWNELMHYHSMKMREFVNQQTILPLVDVTDKTPTWQVIRTIFTTLDLAQNQPEDQATVMKLIEQRQINLTVTQGNLDRTLYGRLLAKGWLTPESGSKESKRWGFEHAKRLPKCRKVKERPSPKISSIPPIRDSVKQQTYELALNQAAQLPSDHAHFLHSQNGPFAVLVDFITETEVPSISRAFHPTLARPHKRFRAPQQSRQFSSVKEFITSKDAGNKQFDNYWFRDVLLSVDADFRSTTGGRSAVSFFREEGSQQVNSAQETKNVIEGLVTNQSMRDLLYRELEIIKGESFHNRLYVISIPDERVAEVVYPAHTNGVMCQKTWDRKETINRIKEANDLSKEPSYQHCCDDPKLQYRLIAPLLDENQEAKVYAFDAMSDTQKQVYRAKVQAVGRWARAAMRLESITKERGAALVLDALRRLPFFEHSKIQQPNNLNAFESAIEEIIKEKRNVLMHYASIISENRSDFPRKVVRLLVKNSMFS